MVISDLRTVTSAEGHREEWEEEETNIKKCVLFPFSCMCAVHVCMCAIHVCMCMLCMCACVCCACVHLCADVAFLG